MVETGKPKYSVVIPVYNSEAIVGDTLDSVVDFFRNAALPFEIIAVNDGSPDGSWRILEKWASKYPEIISIDLLKNYGQHSAVYCGIQNSTGDFIITMDDDLQNPPGEIIHLINKINEGYDVVFAEFKKKQHASYRKLGTRIVDYLNRKVFNKPNNLILTNFRIFTREVADRMNNYKTTMPYIPGLLLLHGSKFGNVLCEHHPRRTGKSNYNIFRILKLVSRLLFNYSSYPIKFLTSVGLGISLLSFLIGLGVILKNIFFGIEVQGWTTMIVLISFLGGFIILMLGVLGQYVVKIMNQVSEVNSYYINKIVK